MLYKYLFSILCGHLNLNQKRKKIEFGRLPIKPTGYQSNRSVNWSNWPVNQYEPFALWLLNSNLTSTGLDRFPTKPVRYTGTGPAGLSGIPVDLKNADVVKDASTHARKELFQRPHPFPISHRWFHKYHLRPLKIHTFR